MTLANISTFAHICGGKLDGGGQQGGDANQSQAETHGKTLSRTVVSKQGSSETQKRSRYDDDRKTSIQGN